MPKNESTLAWACRVYGLVVMTLGRASLAFSEFDPGQRVPEHFPERNFPAFASGVFMVVGAAAVLRSFSS